MGGPSNTVSSLAPWLEAGSAMAEPASSSSGMARLATPISKLPELGLGEAMVLAKKRKRVGAGQEWQSLKRLEGGGGSIHTLLGGVH